MGWGAGPRWCASSRRSPSICVRLRDWLAGEGVSQVVMEATGVYWRPVWHVLEEHRGVELMLVNARHVKNLPGRKTDVADACVAGAAVGVRVVARFVRAATGDRPAAGPDPLSHEAGRRNGPGRSNGSRSCWKTPGIKLDSVVTDVMGKAARQMLDALIAGETDVEVMAEMARTRMRPKIPELRLALEGRFDDHHALMLPAASAATSMSSPRIDRPSSTPRWTS